MASDDNKQDKPKAKGFFKQTLENIKDFGVGVATALPHIVNHPADAALKGTVVGLSAIPGVGAAVTAIYAAKHAYANSPGGGVEMLKAGVKGLILGTIAFLTTPIGGPAITGIYAAKDIGAQVENEMAAKRLAGDDKANRLTGVKEQWQQAGKRIVNIVESVKNFSPSNLKKAITAKAKAYVENVKDKGFKGMFGEMRKNLIKTMGPFTPKQRQEMVKDMAKKRNSERPNAKSKHNYGKVSEKEDTLFRQIAEGEDKTITSPIVDEAKKIVSDTHEKAKHAPPQKPLPPIPEKRSPTRGG